MCNRSVADVDLDLEVRISVVSEPRMGLSFNPSRLKGAPCIDNRCRSPPESSPSSRLSRRTIFNRTLCGSQCQQVPK